MSGKAKDIERAVDQAVETVAEQLGQLGGGIASGEPIGLENLLDVPVRVTVQIGKTSMTLGELVALGPGSLIPLDREAHEPADILVNGRIIARGEVVTIDNTYGVRISHLEKDA
ncbi:MAG: flagellar motor switch protein FliN [Planctomycetes bacterium]|nr:flagellar motor switch protein FliN [Planctomycetota bacterium]MCB9909989.1 flagellar motor switch protein FliN [Planctomycetota bacterium]HPF12723.1 flagellar motor switch protein FliN [Planctomycetota bacterium]HRV80386.1 flagellar motor switch protein FliN [Planctomycetota bacterium]